MNFFPADDADEFADVAEKICVNQRFKSAISAGCIFFPQMTQMSSQMWQKKICVNQRFKSAISAGYFSPTDNSVKNFSLNFVSISFQTLFRR